MYRLYHLILVIPFYCILMAEGFSDGNMLTFGSFLYLVLLNSLIIFKHKINNLDKFLYVLNCLVVFPFGFYTYIPNINLVLFGLCYLMMISLFFSLFFIEINDQITHLVLVVFTLIFGINNLYINVKLNGVSSFIFVGILHFLCFPNSKKYKFIKFIKRNTSRKDTHN